MESRNLNLLEFAYMTAMQYCFKHLSHISYMFWLGKTWVIKHNDLSCFQAIVLNSVFLLDSPLLTYKSLHDQSRHASKCISVPSSDQWFNSPTTCSILIFSPIILMEICTSEAAMKNTMTQLRQKG